MVKINLLVYTQAAMGMEEGENIGMQCANRPYPFGAVVPPKYSIPEVSSFYLLFCPLSSK